MNSKRIPLVIYVVSLIVYLATCGDRLFELPPGLHQHLTYLADGWLHGRLSLEGTPPHGNDWARITEVTLKDGRTLRGTFLVSDPQHPFRTTRGEELTIPDADIVAKKNTYYVSFPWFPAVLMLPFVAIWGIKFNDVIFTAFLAALNPVLIYFVLRKLSALKLSTRSLSDDLWLVALFAFGTVHYFASVRGQVFFTAHVVGVGLMALYLLAALEGRHPFYAGLCLGLGFVTRPSLLFCAGFLLFELWRLHTPWIGKTWNERLRHIAWRPFLKDMALAALPILAIGIIAAILNQLRFDDPFEFGHRYLNIRWTERIERWGLFNYNYIPRNLAVMFALLPRTIAEPPYIQFSYHGLSIFLTTPLLIAVVWPRMKSLLQPALYLAVLGPMILDLMYQHTGWHQFGYRFSLDYTVFLVALIALSGWPIDRLGKALICVGIVVNTFGAITFFRISKLYWNGMFPVE